MEKTLVTDRSSDIEMMSDNDNSKQMVVHLEPHRPVALLSEAVQEAIASLKTSADSALRPKHAPADGKGLDEVKAYYTSWQPDYIDTHFDRIGTDGGRPTKTKEPSCSPTKTSMLARQMPQRLSSEDENSLDPTAARIGILFILIVFAKFVQTPQVLCK